MDYPTFLKHVANSGGTASEATLRLWHHIYKWVLLHEYADTADTPEFVKYVQEFRNLSVPTINSHLKKMSSAGLLARHTLRRKLPKELREGFFNPVINMFFGGDDLPSTFVRYCKPSAVCSCEFKSAERAMAKMQQKVADLKPMGTQVSQ